MHTLGEGIEYAQNFAISLKERYDNLSYQGKLLVWVSVGFHTLVSGVLFIIGPATVFGWMAGWAEGLRDMTGGSLLLVGLIVLTSFPPLMGYGTCITLAGFAFGPYQGWVVGASGCLVGGALSFLVTRRLLSYFLPYFNENAHFRALSRAMSVKGLPLITLVRLMPLSYPYSNLLMASTESVTFAQFMLATLAITPKLFLHVWVGSRMFAFADPDTRGKMDTKARWVNGIFVALGTAVGIATSWYLYRLTMKYVAEAELSLGDDDLEAGLLEREVDELLDEDEDEDEADLTARPEGPHRLGSMLTSTPHLSREALPLHTFDNGAAMTRGLSGPSHHSLTQTPAPPPMVSRTSHQSHQSEDWGEGEFSDFEDKHPHRQSTEDEDGWGLDEVQEEAEGDQLPPVKGKDRWLD